MRCAVALTLLGIAALVLPSVAAPAQPKHSNAKTVKAHAASKGKSHTRTRRRSRSRRHVAVRPSFQLHPDPGRYQQIQQALATRGYFKGTANGVWKDDSVDALRRFQTDQKITDNDGKINALSLNALGLGAKHDSSYLSPTAVAGAIPAADLPPPPSEQPAPPDASATPPSSPH